MSTKRTFVKLVLAFSLTLVVLTLMPAEASDPSCQTWCDLYWNCEDEYSACRFQAYAEYVTCVGPDGEDETGQCRTIQYEAEMTCERTFWWCNTEYDDCLRSCDIG